MIEDAIRYLPPEKPRYLMGVGSLDYLLGGVERGVDMMDCVLPTRIARHGALMTSAGRINIRNAKYKDDFSPFSHPCALFPSGLPPHDCPGNIFPKLGYPIIQGY